MTKIYCKCRQDIRRPYVTSTKHMAFWFASTSFRKPPANKTTARVRDSRLEINFRSRLSIFRNKVCTTVKHKKCCCFLCPKTDQKDDELGKSSDVLNWRRSQKYLHYDITQLSQTFKCRIWKCWGWMLQHRPRDCDSSWQVGSSDVPQWTNYHTRFSYFLFSDMATLFILRHSVTSITTKRDILLFTRATLC